MPGVPSIYYGSEWGIKGEKGTGKSTDDAIRPELSIKEFEDSTKDLVEHIKILADIRRKSDAIKYGEYEEILVKNQQFVFARILGNEVKFVALNMSESREKVMFEYKKKRYEVSIQPYSACTREYNSWRLL